MVELFVGTSSGSRTSGENRCHTVDYRHQWMNGARQVLRRRWDSTPDHPELDNFPYHVHVVDEQDVQPDKPMSILELLKWFEAHFQ